MMVDSKKDCLEMYSSFWRTNSPKKTFFRVKILLVGWWAAICLPSMGGGGLLVPHANMRSVGVTLESVDEVLRKC